MNREPTFSTEAIRESRSNFTGPTTSQMAVSSSRRPPPPRNARGNGGTHAPGLCSFAEVGDTGHKAPRGPPAIPAVHSTRCHDLDELRADGLHWSSILCWYGMSWREPSLARPRRDTVTWLAPLVLVVTLVSKVSGASDHRSSKGAAGGTAKLLASKLLHRSQNDAAVTDAQCGTPAYTRAELR